MRDFEKQIQSYIEKTEVLGHDYELLLKKSEDIKTKKKEGESLRVKMEAQIKEKKAQEQKQTV